MISRFAPAVALLALIALGHGAVAQPSASLSGYVRDASTSETLLLANVTVLGTTLGGATNREGFYTVQGIPPGTYTVLVSYVGYERRAIEVTLSAGETRRLDVELPAAPAELEELVVRAGHTRAAGLERSDRIQIPAITESLSILEPDLFRSLALLPGVTTTSDYSSTLYVRGGDPAQTLIQFDHVTVYNPTHALGIYSMFTPDAIKDVQLFRGAYPAEYGGRLGSVMDVYTREGTRKELGGGLSIGLLASRAHVEGPLAFGSAEASSGSFLIAARRSTIEPVLAAFGEVDGLPEAFYFFDVNAKATYDLNPTNSLSVSLYHGKDDLHLDLDRGTTIAQYANRVLSTEWTRLASDKLFSSATLAQSAYESTPAFAFGNTRATQSNRIRNWTARASVDYAPSAAHSIDAGVRASVLDLRLRNVHDGTELLDERIETPVASAHLTDRYEPPGPWALEGGLRATYFASGSYWRLSPRLSADYEVTPSVRIGLAYGRYHQFVTLETTEVFTASDTWLTAADGVPPAFGDQGVLSVESALGSAWTLEVDAYGRTMDGLFERDPFLPREATVPYADRFRFGTGRAYGTDLLLRRPHGRLNGFLSYTLSRTERRFPNANLSETGVPQYYPPNHDRTHELTVAANYHVSDQWRLSGAFVYSSGRPYTRPEQQYRLPLPLPFLFNPTGSRSRTVFESALNGARLPAYHRLDVGLTRTGTLGAGAEYKLQLQVFNAYAHKNIWFYEYETGNDRPPARKENLQIPVPLPSLSFSLAF